jgi:hypothetical protein
MPEYGKETSDTANHNEGDNKAIRRETDADTFLGLTKNNSCSLSRKGHNSKQSLLQLDVLGLVKMSYLNKMPTCCDQG